MRSQVLLDKRGLLCGVAVLLLCSFCASSRADEQSGKAPEPMLLPLQLPLRGTTALFEDCGVRFKAFADAGTVVELREELTDRGMLRVGRPGEEESFLIWPEAVGRRQAVPFPRGESIKMTVPGTQRAYLLYIPKSYDPEKPGPAVLCIHNRNHHRMLNPLRNACEKHGWIGIGRRSYSNRSRNWAEEVKGVYDILDDVRRRVPHDRRRAYIAAFWGTSLYAYEMARCSWNDFAGVLPFSGWMSSPYKGRYLVYPERMAIAHCLGDAERLTLRYTISEGSMLLHRNIRSRSFLYEGRAGGTPGNLLDGMLHWLDRDWEDVGERLTATVTEDAIVETAHAAWTAAAMNDDARAANLCLGLLLTAPPSPWSQGIEALFMEIMGDREKARDIVLRPPDSMKEEAWQILLQKTLLHAYIEPAVKPHGRRNVFAFLNAALALNPTSHVLPRGLLSNYNGYILVSESEKALAAGDLDHALLLARRSLMTLKEKSRAIGYAALGRVHLFRGDIEQAMRYFNRAVRADADSPTGLYNQGLAYEALGEFDKAIAAYDRAEKTGTDWRGVHYYRGIAYFSLRDLDKALADFRVCLDADWETGSMMLWTHAAKLLKGAADQDALKAYTENDAVIDPVNRIVMDMFLDRMTSAVAMEQIEALPTTTNEKSYARYWAGIHALTRGRQHDARDRFMESMAMGNGFSYASRNELRRMGALSDERAAEATQPEHAGAPPRVALIGSGSQEAMAMATLIEMALSQRSDLIVLDRHEVARMLAEHELTMEGVALSAASAATIGRLLHCDIIAELRGDKPATVGKDDPLVGSLVTFDAMTGVRLGEAQLALATGSTHAREADGAADSYDADAVIERGEAVLVASAGKWRKHAYGKDFRTVSLLSARSVGLPESMRHLTNDIREWLERAFLNSPHVAVVERQRLQHVNLDAAVAGDRRDRLLASSVLIDLDVTRGVDETRVEVRAALSDIDGREIGSVRHEGKTFDVGTFVVELTEKIGRAASELAVLIGPDFLEQEAARYAKRGRGIEDTAVALALAEGALAQDPTDAANNERVVRLLLRQAEHEVNNLQKAEKDEDAPGFAESAERILELLDRTFSLKSQADTGSLEIWQAVHALWSRSEPLSAMQQRRLEKSRKQFLARYKEACLRHHAPFYMGRVRTGTSDPDEYLRFFLDVYGRARSPLENGFSGMIDLKQLRGGAAMTDSPEARRKKGLAAGVQPANVKRLMVMYEKLAAIGDPFIRIEMHFCAAYLAQLYPDLFDDVPGIVARNLQGAADIVAESPASAGEFAYLLYHGEYPVFETPFGPENYAKSNFNKRKNIELTFPDRPAEQLLFPAEMLVPLVRHSVAEAKKRKAPCTSLYSLLDWYDAGQGDYPGYYLDEAARELVRKKISADAVWDQLEQTLSARYGDGARLAVQQPDKPVVVAAPVHRFAFSGTQTLYNAPSAPHSARIHSAELRGETLFLLLEHGYRVRFGDRDIPASARAYEILQVNIPSGDSMSFGRIKADAQVWGQDDPLPAVTGPITVGEKRIHIPVSRGLISVNRTDGAVRSLDRKVLPAGTVRFCLDSDDTLYLSCKDKSGSYLFQCAADGSSPKIVAASARREKRSDLDNCAPYNVGSMLVDRPRNRILLTVGHKLYGWSLDNDAIQEITISRRYTRYCRELTLRLRRDGTLLLAQGESAHTSYAVWDPETDIVQPIVSIREKGIFHHKAGGHANAFAWTDRHMFVATAKDRWIVVEKHKGTKEANLSEPHAMAPFWMRHYGDRLLTVDWTRVRLYDHKDSAIDVIKAARPPKKKAAAKRKADTAQTPIAHPASLLVRAPTRGVVSLNDGPFLGITPDRPLRWNRLPPGTHTITAQAGENLWVETLRFDPDARVELTAFEPPPQDLIARDTTHARLVLSCPEEGTVVLNQDAPLPITPDKPVVWLRLQPGTHTVVVTCWGIDWARTFTLQPGDHLELKPFSKP